MQKLKKRNYYAVKKDIERALSLAVTDEARRSYLLARKLVLENIPVSYWKDVDHTDIIETDVLSYGENNEIKGVSSAIKLNYNKKFGRHFVAVENIESGSILMIQKPYAFSIIRKGYIEKRRNARGKLEDLDRKWFCEYCFDLSVAPVPCNNCSGPLYCSEICRNEAYFKYHKFECTLINFEMPVKSVVIFFVRLLVILTKSGQTLGKMMKLTDVIRNRKGN